MTTWTSTPFEPPGIRAANNPGFNSSSVAEHTIMLMLVVLHRFVAAHDATCSGGFPIPGFVLANQPHLRELGDETVGLIGLGSIGRAAGRSVQRSGPRSVLPQAREPVGCRRVGDRSV